MAPEFVAAVLGPIVGAIFGILGFTSKRNAEAVDAQLNSIAENVEVISHQVTNIQIHLPTKYATKEELDAHIRSEEYFHNKMLDQMREMRDEIITLRVTTGRQ
jgi:chromosome segregation ATPase